MNLIMSTQGFAISVPVLILPIFRRLLLRNSKFSSKCLFSNEQTQRADSRWQQQTYYKSILNKFDIIQFQIALNLDTTAISNQIKYYLTTNKGNACMLLQVCFADLLWLVVERAYATQETMVGIGKNKETWLWIA